MRRLIPFALVLVTLLSLLMGVALLIGQAQPPSERIARLHLTDCDPPCWNRIAPGVSSRGEITARMALTFPDYTALGSSILPFVSWVRDQSSIQVAVDDGLAHSMRIVGNNVLSAPMPTLGDVLAVYGLPSCIIFDPLTDFATLAYMNEADQVILEFSTYQPSLRSPVDNFAVGISYNKPCQEHWAISWQAFRTARHSFLFTS